MKIFTIGFTKKKANYFFNKLIESKVKRIIDVRLNNISQLAGFTKKDDFQYFLKTIADIDYVHYPDFAPTKEILDAYKKQQGSWQVYEDNFLKLMDNRLKDKEIDYDLFDNSCLLCSEDKPHHCHRRLVAEYLMKRYNKEIDIIHLI